METVTVRYIVADAEATKAFYRDLLGFEVVMSPAPGFCMLSRGALRLLLNQPGAGGAGQNSPEPGGWNRFQLQVQDLDAEVERLTRAGARFRGGVVQGNGGRQALVEDPSGNVVELLERAPRDRPA